MASLEKIERLLAAGGRSGTRPSPTRAWSPAPRRRARRTRPTRPRASSTRRGRSPPPSSGRSSPCSASRPSWRRQLGYCTIRSPFDGLVSHRMVDPGDLASPGKSLMVVEDRSRLKLCFDVPQQDLPQVREGLAVTYAVGGRAAQGGPLPHVPLARRRPHAARRGLPGRRRDGRARLAAPTCRCASSWASRRTSRWCRPPAWSSRRTRSPTSSSSTIEHLQRQAGQHPRRRRRRRGRRGRASRASRSS